MTDRLRFLLDRPLDPLAARAVVILATAILLGFAAVFVLGVSESSRTAISHEPLVPNVELSSRLDFAASGTRLQGPQRQQHHRRQDPQDEKGSPAARNAQQELRSHRALQHVPYGQGGVKITLAGVRRGRALLRVSAAASSTAHRGWSRFLRRFGDTGRAYVPVFEVSRPKGGA